MFNSFVHEVMDKGVKKINLYLVELVDQHFPVPVS